MVGVAVERVVAETGLVLGVAGLVGPIRVRFMTSAPDFFGAQPGPQELISRSHMFIEIHKCCSVNLHT